MVATVRGSGPRCRPPKHKVQVHVFDLSGPVNGGMEPSRPRELRHSFVSLLSAHNVALEEIARLVGHSSTHVTETVYRHETRLALTEGAVVMDKIFKSRTG